MKTSNGTSLVIDTGTHKSRSNGNLNQPVYTTLGTNGNTNHYIKEVNGNLSYGWKGSQDKFEIPLPFGYHMDLDFLRFCSDDLVSGETLDRLKDLRKQRRKQRKTLEALMGIRQEQKEKERKKFLTDVRTKISPPKTALAAAASPLSRRQPPPDVVNTPEFIRDALKDAVQDFENHLERSKEEDKYFSGLQSFDLLNSGLDQSRSSAATKTSKFNTFPRALSSPEENVTSTFKLYRQSSNSSIGSSISTSSSALPYQTPLSPDAVLANLPSSVPSKSQDPMETDSIASITSEMSTHTLKNIREQMAKSLSKLKEYERQVEAIPVMQVKLSVMKEEKRLLMLKLKQRELQLRRERGELEDYDAGHIDYDTEADDDEDLEEKVDRMSKGIRHRFQEMNSRARSESPYARGGVINPDDFISVRRIRSASCGYNSDSDLIAPMSERRYFEHDRGNLHRMQKSSPYYNLSSSHLESTPKQKSSPPAPPPKPKDLRTTGINTDPIPEPPAPKVEERKKSPPPVRKRDRAINTDPPPRSPPPPRKIHHGTNTVNVRTMARGTGTLMAMDTLVTKDEMEAKIQEAVFKTEEEIMGCPLLQRAMAKVEYEAIHGPETIKEEVETTDSGCQVGDDNLRPFVISVGLQCKLDDSRPIVLDEHNESKRRSIDPEEEKLVRSIGVGECKIIEDPAEPARYREIGVCTEKWVEVIKASKQTDTEDFAFKDTESPRVADMVFEPSPERVVLERRSSLRRQSAGSPSLSRKSSVNSPVPSRRSSALSTATTTPVKPVMKTQGTMTLTEVKAKVSTRDARTGSAPTPTKSVGTSALILPLNKNLPAPGSPLTTPEREKPAVNLCDKCDSDIQKVAQGIMVGPTTPSPKLAPPSPDMPWLSKIPRPVNAPENPDVHKLKSATSIGNLSIENRSRSPIGMQRSKSNLTPTMGRKLMSPKSPIPVGTRDVGTPPPHPSTPPVGSRRAPSPLARSQSPYGERRSLIPKLSPGTQRKQAPSPLEAIKASPPSTGTSTPSREVAKSLIPRVVTPPALRKMYPKGDDKLSTPDRNVVRKNTFTKITVGVNNPDLEKGSDTLKSLQEMRKKSEASLMKTSSSDMETSTSSEDDKTAEANKAKGLSSAGFPLPGAALFAPIDENRTKVEPSKEMRGALKVLNDSLGRNTRGNAQVTNAINIIQQEWFKISSTKQSNPLDVEDYLDAIEDMSKELLDRVVNLTDVNGNTALHYSVSHGNFDVVSVLLDSKVSNSNIMNKAGYTCIMLISLAQISTSTHRAVVARLFSLGDVNFRATQHGQTALMLAVSHGRLDMVQLLVEAGADINIRDEDGSTALMCAAEHGHMDIVKHLLQHPETNVLAKDNDGLTALAVAMEAGHRDVGVVLYANMSFSRGPSRGTSPYSSMRIKKGGGGSRTATPTGGAKATPPRSPMGPTPPLRTRRNSSNQ